MDSNNEVFLIVLTVWTNCRALRTLVSILLLLWLGSMPSEAMAATTRPRPRPHSLVALRTIPSDFLSIWLPGLLAG